METIAMYWESKVRTYGFQLVQGLHLCRAGFPMDGISALGAFLQRMAGNDLAFRAVWAQADGKGQIRIYLLCDSSQLSKLRVFGSDEPLLASDRWAASQLVDMICFQGPHFGDRYGIVDYSLKALASAKMPVWGAVCSTATIHLVVPAGRGDQAKQLLTDAFEIPK
ncbi:MAG: hypothetical protein HKP58_12190 [Desulfatitalea sp.]|nr:hypothetical protein [Desulfatitalea sp.]NNK01161.1 hypothetical protein [Desulfatitalea sp.]